MSTEAMHTIPSLTPADPQSGKTGFSISAYEKRDLVSAVCADWRRIVTAMAAMAVLTLGMTVYIVPKYVANSTLLVLLSSEYSTHQEAGRDAPATAMLEKDAFLKAETEILKSAELEKKALAQLGIANVYPRYLEQPSLAAQLANAVVETVRSGLASLGLRVSPPRTVDVMERARTELDRNLTATADKAGNIINVTFRHPDPAVSARMLNSLVALYLERRHQLYSDVQSGIVAEQASTLRAKLDQAMRALADFKARHSIANYETQRDILLHQSGDLARELQQADSAIVQANRQLEAIQTELRRTPNELVLLTENQTGERVENLKNSIEEMQLRASALEQHYDARSRPVVELHEQIAAAQAQLQQLQNDNAPSMVRRGRNVVYDNFLQDAARIRLELQAALARKAVVGEQITQVKAELDQLEENQVDLRKLEEDVATLETAYRASVRNLEERRSLEDLASRKAANVRVVQAAEDPIRPQNIRLAVLAGGLLLTLFVGVLVAVLSSVFRRGFVSPKEVEHRLAVPVLSSIPEFAVAK